jgi:hypothetical protein
VDSQWNLLALRAMLAGDSKTFEAAGIRIAESGEYQQWGLLVACAFCIALRNRFSAGYTNSDVIHIVAEERARFRGSSRDFDPQLAEQLVHAALGNGSAEGIPDDVRARVQSALLTGLVLDAKLDDAALDEFLAEVREFADAAKSHVDVTKPSVLSR